MLLGNLVLTARLHQVYRCLIKILTGEGSLFKEFLPAVVNLLRSVQVLLRNLGIGLGAARFLHTLSEFEQHHVITSRWLTGGAVLDGAGQGGRPKGQGGEKGH